MGLKLFSHKLNFWQQQKYQSTIQSSYSWANTFSPVFIIQNTTSKWTSYSPVHCIHGVIFTEDVQGYTTDEITWHCIQITFSQVKIEMSSKSLGMTQIILSRVWTVLELNLTNVHLKHLTRISDDLPTSLTTAALRGWKSFKVKRVSEFRAGKKKVSTNREMNWWV